MIIKPKQLVDAHDVLTPPEETVVRRGEAQLKNGQRVSWGPIHAHNQCTYDEMERNGGDKRICLYRAL